MTNDDDRVAYPAGEEGVDLDDVARADRNELKARAADTTVWAEPSDHLEDVVVDAITAEAPRRPDHDHRVVTRASRTVVTPLRPRHRAWRALTAATAVAVLAAGGLVIATRGGDVDGAEFSLGPTEILPTANGHGTATRTDSGWRIELDAEGLPRLDDGRFYQAWLKSDDDVLVPIGSFNEAEDVVLWAGVSPVLFPTITVTEEQADGDQASSGRRVLVGTITID